MAMPPELRELIRSLSASPLQAFVKVRFLAALPHVFVGLKVAISLAVIGAVIGEFVGASHGLGYVIQASQSNVNTSRAFRGDGAAFSDEHRALLRARRARAASRAVGVTRERVAARKRRMLRSVPLGSDPWPFPFASD